MIAFPTKRKHSDRHARLKRRNGFRSILFGILFLFGDLSVGSAQEIITADGTYLEANDLLNYIWRGGKNRALLSDIVSQEYLYVCLLAPNGISVNNWRFGAKGLLVSKLVSGEIVDDWDTSALYKVVMIDERGQAAIWNFDERIFKVEIGEGDTKDNSGKECLDFDTATISYEESELYSNGIDRPSYVTIKIDQGN